MTRKIVHSMMVSLDGYIARPDRSIDWIIVDEELHSYVNDLQKDVDTYLHGRRMYELMAEFWPTADENPDAPGYIADFARIWREMPKIVVSKTLKQVVGQNERLVRDLNADDIAALKQQPGKSIGVGGAEMAATLMRLDLIDEYWLYVNPVILGSGVPMFPVLSESQKLRLVETRTFGSGVVMLHYTRDRTED